MTSNYLAATVHRTQKAKPVHPIVPALGLFLLAPLIAEFLLGNMSITHLGLLVILAPVYGGGALLIRECVRRAGRGWPGIFVLALAYGVLEEAFLTQSLFNPNYLALNLDLLKPAFLPPFGIGAWYTIFVLTLHTVWSISVPVALIEALVPTRADSPWLGEYGLGVCAMVFTFACVSLGNFSARADAHHFVASRPQFAWSAIIILALIAAALWAPRRIAASATGAVPSPWILGAGSLAVASAFLLIPREWGWWAVVAYLSLDAIAILAIAMWSGRVGWSALHKLNVAGGAAMAYACHAFVQTPSLGKVDSITRIGNLLFAVMAASLVAAGARKAGAPARQNGTSSSVTPC